MVGHIKESNRSKYEHRQQVIDKVHELYSSGETKHLFLPTIIKNDGVELLSSSIRLFGGWENAIIKAGLGSEILGKFNTMYNEFWSEDTIIEQLQLLFTSGFDLRFTFIKHAYPELYSAAIKKVHFGNWRSALVEAEIEITDLKTRLHRFWSASRIARAIVDHHEAYGNIQPEFIRQINPSLYSNSRQYFKTWRSAVEYSGLELGKNWISSKLDHFRSVILMALLKNIYKLLAIDFKEIPIYNQDNIGVHEEDGDEIKLMHSIGLPLLFLEVIQDKERKLINTSHRAWGTLADHEINLCLRKCPCVVCYYSIGEPREGYGKKVRFFNVDHYYQTLIEHGRDDIIADLSLVTRGGVPAEFQDQYSNLMKEIKKQIKDIKK